MPVWRMQYLIHAQFSLHCLYSVNWACLLFLNLLCRETPTYMLDEPKLGWDKMNVDASYTEESGTVSWGAIIRNNLGEAILSALGFLQSYPSAKFGGAIAILRELKLALVFSENPLVVESAWS